MANQPIPVAQANTMMQDYRSYMTGLGVDISRQTQTVSFDAAILAQWINDVLPNSDEFRICFGSSSPTDTGKLTAIVWPYKNGQPATETAKGVVIEIEPFNMGQGQP